MKWKRTITITNSRGSSDSSIFGGCGCFLLILFINLMFGGIASRYVVEILSPAIVHKTVILPWIPAVIIGVIGGEVIIPLAVIIWIIMLFV